MHTNEEIDWAIGFVEALINVANVGDEDATELCVEEFENTFNAPRITFEKLCYIYPEHSWQGIVESLPLK